MAFLLADDGTMDTVLRCDECGIERRYNYDSAQADEVDPNDDGDAYDAFVQWAIDDANEDHVCPETEPEDDTPTEPEDGDLTTEDHERFYQHGKLVLQRDGDVWYAQHGSASNRPMRTESLGRYGDDYKMAVRRYMEVTQYWPNVWFISDHGNAHILDLSDGA